jgi:hypothetical protein
MTVSFDVAAAMNRRYSFVKPVDVPQAMQLELGTLSQQRHRDEAQRRQKMRHQQVKSNDSGHVRRRKSISSVDMAIPPERRPGEGGVTAGTSIGVAPVAPGHVDIPGHYLLRDIPEALPALSRINHTIVNYRGTLYLYGGRTGTTPAAQYVQDMFYFAAARNQWATVEDRADEAGIGGQATRMQRNRRDGDKAMRNILSGNTGRGHDRNEELVQDPAQHPGRRGDHSAVVVGDEMYIYGGRRQQAVLDDLFAYNFITETWRKVDNERLTGPGPLFGHATCFSEETQRMYIVGGTHLTAYDNNRFVFSWDVKFRYWRRFPAPRDVAGNELHRVACVCHGETLYVYGLCNSHDDHVLFAMDEATGTWKEAATTGHPHGGLGVLWNLVAPVYIRDSGVWVFVCSNYGASTPTATHVTTVNPGSPAVASSPRATTVSAGSEHSRRMSVAPPGGSLKSPRSTMNTSTMSARSGKGGASAANISPLFSTRAVPSVIAQAPPAVRETAVWLMALQMSTMTWSKVTLHGSVAPHTPRSAWAGSIFTRLLVPNTSAFERKYYAVPYNHDGTTGGLSVLICGGSSDDDRVFVRLLPRKGLPPALSSLAHALPSGDVNAGAGAFCSAAGGGNKDSKREASSSSRGVKTRRGGSLKNVSIKVPTLLRSLSSFAPDATADGAATDSTASPAESPDKGAARRTRVSGSSLAMSQQQRGSFAPLGQSMMSPTDVEKVIVVPCAPEYRLPSGVGDPSGCPVASLTAGQASDWEAQLYAAECDWLYAQKDLMDVAEATAQRRLKIQRSREAKERKLFAALSNVVSPRLLNPVESSTTTEADALKAKEEVRRRSLATLTTDAARRRFKAAYSRVGIPVFQQKDVVLSHEQRHDTVFRALLRWELVRRYVRSGAAARDGAVHAEKERRRLAAERASGNAMAGHMENPFTAVDELLWPTSSEGFIPRRTRTGKHSKQNRVTGGEGLASDDDAIAPISPIKPTTGPMISYLQAARSAAEPAQMDSSKRRFGSAGAIATATAGVPRVLRPTPPKSSVSSKSRPEPSSTTDPGAKKQTGDPDANGSVMSLAGVLQGEAATDRRRTLHASVKSQRFHVPLAFSSE